MTNIGKNAREAVVGYAERMQRLLDEIAERQDDIREIRAEAKADGFDVKVLNKVVQELRKGAKYQQDQLEMELVLDTYRAAAGLPTRLEDAQAAVRAGAEGGA